MSILADIRNEIREGGEYRLGSYGSFWRRFAIANWRWSIALCKFEDSWSLHLFCLWIKLWATRTPPHEIMESWGFTFSERTLHLNWGRYYKILYMPWDFDHCRTEVMLADGTFVPELPWEWDTVLDKRKEPEGRFEFTAPYHYVLRDWAVQEVEATVTVERRSWCWRAWPFKAWRWPSKTVTSIEVQFSGEVGDRAGSWKGGCIGCGYELRPNETPQECLRRMEQERKFR